MNSNPDENRELDALVNQPKETHKKGLLLGTDFRHAVEFSKSGRSRHPAGWAFDRGGCSTLRRSPCPSSGGCRTRGRRSERAYPVQPATPGGGFRSPPRGWGGGGRVAQRGG